MNSMCDLTQFVISSAVQNINAEVISKTFMVYIALSFGMIELVFVDTDSKFRSIFEEMYTALKIYFWPLARGNHKGLLVDQYDGYLNKTQTIAGQDHVKHLSILQNAKISQFAWNSAPIYNTDVPHSLVAVGGDFQTPLDIDLSGIPNLSYAKGTTLYNYLRGVSTDSIFFTSV